LGFSVYLLQDLVDCLQAADDLTRRLKTGVQQHFVQTPRAQALRRCGNRLATELEEDGDNRQEPVNHRQNRLCLFDTAADQAARRGLNNRRGTTQPEPPGKPAAQANGAHPVGPGDLLTR
jgi:hypothetical protein